ncbi:hypothetical protein FYF77_16880 [Vibrio cholerae]|nr:hypothetical protein [Vibrio cholerae]EGR0076605.1 hypothetical protein [Vibrio cholerae]
MLLITFSDKYGGLVDPKTPFCTSTTKSADFILYPPRANARLRGWQRITTKLKHNNRNLRGSLGLETPRVDSPA